MAFIPDHRPRLQRATRFFARPERFLLECPHCGMVYRCNSTLKQMWWDPWTSTFTCNRRSQTPAAGDGIGGCGRVYVIGIVAWPVTQRSRRSPTLPKDQIPGPRELSQLRADGSGWWLSDEDKQKYPEVRESNLTTELDRPVALAETEEDEDT